MNDKQVNKDNKAIANKKIYSEVRATALRPCLHHREGFYYPLLDPPQRDLTIRNYNYLEYTTLNSILYTRDSTKPIEVTSSW